MMLDKQVIVYKCSICGKEIVGYITSISADVWKRYFHIRRHTKYLKLKDIKPKDWVKLMPIKEVSSIAKG